MNLFRRPTAILLALLAGAAIAQETSGPSGDPTTGSANGLSADPSSDASPGSLRGGSGSSNPAITRAYRNGSTGNLEVGGGFFEAVNETTYVVGPGDGFYIGFDGRTAQINVGPDGNILIEAMQPFPAVGKTLLVLRREIGARLSRAFKSGPVFLVLSNPKNFKVSITGAIGDPGFYSLGVGARLSGLIQEASGLSVQASFLTTIRHASGDSENFNIQDYYRNGNLKQNPYLAQGDRVFVNAIDYDSSIVYIRADNGTRIAQLLDGDNLESVIQRVYNFRITKEWDHVDVYEKNTLVSKVSRADTKRFFPKPYMLLEIRSAKPVVFVGGTTLSPGIYDYNPAFTVMDYVSLSGITINTGNFDRVHVYDSQGKSRPVRTGTEAVLPGDHIMVPRSYEAKTRDYIGITTALSSLAIAVATFVALSH